MVQLDVATPSFVSLTIGADPINDAFKINYDGAKAVDQDVGVTHVINYKVTFKEYAGIAAHTGSFNFIIKCPETVVSSAISKAIESFNYYDVPNPAMSTIEAPVITLIPGVCFTITGYKLTLKDDPAATLPEFIAVAADLSGIVVNTNDRQYVGEHSFTITSLTSSSEEVQAHDFKLTI